MTKHFLTKAQQKHLEGKGWDLIPSPDGCVWIGGDWDDKRNMLCTMSDILPCLDLDGEVTGYNFLIIGYNEDNIEEEDDE